MSNIEYALLWSQRGFQVGCIRASRLVFATNQLILSQNILEHWKIVTKVLTESEYRLEIVRRWSVQNLAVKY